MLRSFDQSGSILLYQAITINSSKPYNSSKASDFGLFYRGRYDCHDHGHQCERVQAQAPIILVSEHPLGRFGKALPEELTTSSTRTRTVFAIQGYTSLTRT
jgi:hypothetical protein